MIESLVARSLIQSVAVTTAGDQQMDREEPGGLNPTI